jgi:hypothetical protein
VETLVGAAVLVVVFIVIVVATRKKPDRRYDENPAGHSDADIDEWGGI